MTPCIPSRVSTMAKAAPWLKELRSLVRREHGAGWVLEGDKDRFKIQKIDGPRKGARRPTVRTQIPFTPSSVTEIVNLINSIKSKMDELNMDLATAYSLIAKSPKAKESGLIDWKKISELYRDSRIDSGDVKKENYETNEEYKINRCLNLIFSSKNAAHNGKQLMEKYTEEYLKKVPTGGSGRVITMGTLTRFLEFSVRKCGASTKWLPPDKKEIKSLIGKRTKANPIKQSPPVKPDQLFALLDSLYDKPELRLAVALVGLFGLRPAELMTLEVQEGKLYVGPVKRNANTNEAQKNRLVMPLDLKELPNEGQRVLKQFESGLIKLPPAIRNAKQYKKCGDAFRQYLDRHPHWQSLVKSNSGLSPYGLRHGYAWRGSKYYSRSIPLRDLAALMGHDPKTHHKHYGKWTDEADIAETVERITELTFTSK